MADEEAKKWKRANYVPAPHFYNLNQACSIINRALPGYGSYLVGSSIERRDFRDVDVRYIMDDPNYQRLFGNEDGWANAFWSLLCTTWSTWLSQQSGLQVDFQIQQQTRANREHAGQKRAALGIFLDYPGERPVPHE